MERGSSERLSVTPTQIPTDFPSDYLGGVPGAQPKLLVQVNERGEYVSDGQALRRVRWECCADLCDQLVNYVDSRWDGHESREAFVDKVVQATGAKKEIWGLSASEVAWIQAQVRKRCAAEGPHRGSS